MKRPSDTERPPSPEDMHAALQRETEAKRKAISDRREEYKKRSARNWVELQPVGPLSESIIWQLQKDYYSEKGPDAWRHKDVPHYITSNSYIARAYARVALGWLQDLARNGFGGTAHILELGAGPGQFSFLFLQHLEILLGQTALPTIPFRYVMSDYAESNIRFWEHHPAFKPHLEKGILDFAHFDPNSGEALNLLLSGDSLQPKGEEQPIFAIANYFFDSTPIDIFEVVKGQLHHCPASILLPEDVDPSAPVEAIQELKIEYQPQAVQSPHYQKQDWESALLNTAEQFKNGSLLFPTSALQIFENLLQLSGNQLFILSADKGSMVPREFEGGNLPQLARHGSISHHVNYLSMKHWVKEQGGETWHNPDPSISLQICAFAWPAGIGNHPLTWEAFREAIVVFGPDEFFQLKSNIENQFSGMSTSGILSYLSLAGWDPKATIRSLKHLEIRLEDVGSDQVEQARLATGRSSNLLFSLDLDE